MRGWRVPLSDSTEGRVAAAARQTNKPTVAVWRLVVSLAGGSGATGQAARPRQFTLKKHCGIMGKLGGDAAAAAAATEEMTCGICLEDSKDPLELPCGHSFCDGCLGGWRSRYGVDEEMRTKCPICRARIPPSKDMVTTLLGYRAAKQKMENDNDTSSERYHITCRVLADYEEKVGADWDGVTVLQDTSVKPPPLVLSDYIIKAIAKGDIKYLLRWINANRTEDRVNAETPAERMGSSCLMIANIEGNLEVMTLLLQLGANVDYIDSRGITALGLNTSTAVIERGDANERVRLLLSWGASFFAETVYSSKEGCIQIAKQFGNPELVNLLESELGGRRCEIINLSSRPELNDKTCVVDEFLPDTNQYKVTLENKTKGVLVLSPDNLKRRDRTPQDCGYYIEYKNGRTIRHDFDSSEDCQAFVATLNKGETQPAVTEEAEARAEQAAAELLAELELDDSPNESSSGCRAKKSKKKKRGKKKKNQK